MMRGLAIILFFVTAKAVTFSKRAAGGCETQADVTFLLDSSDVVGKDNFQKQLEFVKNTVNDMDVGSNKARISVVTYSSGVYNQFFLNQYSSKADVVNAISGIPFYAGRPHTADAIRYVTQTSFNPVHGSRSNVPHIAVMVTNGPSTSKEITKLEAQTAKDNNIIMYGVGVGNGVDKDELQSITSDPDSRYLLHAEHYGSLNSLSNVLSTRLCNELPASSASLPAPTSCLHNADVVFLIDSSSSVGPGNYQKIENYLKNTMSKMDIGPNKVHVGLMQYSSYPSVEFPLNLHNDRTEAMKAVENLKYMSGGTNTADAIKYMKDVMFAQNSGARPNVPRIAIVLTDGGSINSAATTAQADNARGDNIGLVAVGVGNAGGAELNNIANSPASEHVVAVNSYSDLDGAVDQVLSKTCNLQTTVAPQTTGPTAATTCIDKQANCNLYGNDVCTRYGPWSHDNCAKFCGFCQAVKKQCNDTLPNCFDYGLNSCTQYPEWAQANCQQFCGYCKDQSSAGFYGKCSYKGKEYITGAKWTDGCSYDCVCEDGNTGSYRCFNKCPLYHDLPKDCTLIKKDGECCLQPVCNFRQQIQKFESTGTGQTSSGIKVCVYKTKQYFQGQTWQDGCDYQCTCTNSTIGLYKCDSVCPQYNSLPSKCHLDKKPGDCCQEPICEYDQQQGSFQGFGTVTGNGIGAVPTTPKPCVDAINTCAQYGKSVCTSYTGWSSDNCAKYCGICNSTAQISPNTNGECLFKGKSYKQGENWSDGCGVKCLCENAAYGYYRCINTCPSYNNLPVGCTIQNRPGQCCKAVRCDGGSFVSSTTTPGSIGDGGMVQVINPSGPVIYNQPTTIPGTTNAPGTGGTGFIGPTLRGCLYKGILHVQDETWQDGCSYSCQCRNDTQGTYACRPRCPMYQNLPTTCRMETDVNDPCCKAPKCRYDPITGTTFLPIPSFQASVMYHGLVRPPTTGELLNNSTYTGEVIIFATGHTPAPPTQQTNITGGIGYCIYRGAKYTQGQSWQDGCQYNCVCENSITGLYRCVDMCNHYGELPAQYCFLNTDPSNPCCKVPECHFPIQFITNTGYISTAKPPTDYCEYKGTHYKQGQSWFDGCSYKCTCDDALGGIYSCIERCAHFQNLNPNCTFVPDPNDPTCCRIPHCPVSGPLNGSASLVPTPAPNGVYTGFEGNNIGKCIYKSTEYTQGEQWSDGCDLDCQCSDASTGRYTCTDKCSKYPNLPPQCRLVSDFTNPCCKKPQCSFTTSGNVVTGQATYAPGAPTPAPNPIATLAPTAQYCIYNGAKYIQGQSWEDSCQYKCRCDDASRGIYTCSERCPTFENLPANCGLVADYKDPCCLAPRCITPPLTGNATGQILTPDMIPTAAPGIVVGHINIPTPAPKPGAPTNAPPKLTWCEYKGQRHSQGQKWFDGCDYECTCTSAATGTYKCQERCARYMNVPDQCRLVKDPSNPCCKTPLCDPVTIAPSAYPSPGFGPTLAPNVGPTLVPPHGINVPTAAPKPTDVCIYKGVSYSQGQQWFDGCDYKCFCENGPAGVYRCDQRCNSYPGLPADCSLVPDPNDAICCKVPQCHYTRPNGTVSGYGLIPTAVPGVINGGSVVKPTPRPHIGPTPVPQPGVSTPTPSPGLIPDFKDVCVYKGQKYNQGQKWADGCDYNCECVDAKSGLYQCTERCTRYVNLPAECQLVRDYLNPCCEKPYCEFKPTPAPTQAPKLTFPPNYSTKVPGEVPTPRPNAGVCVYSGVHYQQGQSWADGCDLNCVCENATTGYFRCDDRCPHYASVPRDCQMVTDPRDSCCKRPLCAPSIQPTPRPGQIPTPGPGLTYPPWMLVTPTPGPGLTYAPDKMPPLTYPPGLVPTPGPHMTYAPGLVPTLTYPPGLIPTLAPTPGPGLTYPPGKIPTKAPIPVPTAIPGIIEGTGVGVSGKGKVCVYKGAVYHQGQTWQDGCSYNCECIDENSGRYRCVERCPLYLSVPSYCRLVVDSKDTCCKKPQCTPPPNGIPTSHPQPQSHTTNGPTLKPGLTPTNGPGQPGHTNPGPNPNTVSPGVNPTGAPTPSQGSNTQIPQLQDVCVYKGVTYSQGQQWFDGCEKKCVCENGKSGYYRCDDRCAKFANIPNECTLTADPNDPQCCQVPQCIPIPGINPTPNPTDGPVIYTNVPGIITGIGATPTPRPGQTPPNQPTAVPQLKDECIYKGSSYHQGQQWQDGCKYNCECKDGKTGLYECKERCSTFPVVPPQCQLKRNPQDFCCFVPVCNFNQSVPTPSPVPVSGFGPTAAPPPGGQQPTSLKPGQTPGLNPTNSPNPNATPSGQAPILAFCVYNGVPFQQGQTWDQGCSKKCRCDNAMTNYYSCFDRCPSFDNLAADCYLTTDPNDPCCQVPVCPNVPTRAPYLPPTASPPLYTGPPTTLPPGVTPPKNPTGAPGMPTQGPYAVPNANPYPVPTLPPGKINGHGPETPQGVPQRIGFCEYKGVQYTKGQKWDDGCTYKCECIEASSGSYTCTERCPRFATVPSYCTMQTDPKDKCCRVPYCPPTAAPPKNPTASPSLKPGDTLPPTLKPNINPTPSPTPQKDVCVFNGKTYSQGQKWYDGCDKLCVCMNEKTGYYTCSDRCPTYQGLDPRCIMVPDPNDPTCCKAPQCGDIYKNTTTPVGVHGQITGIGKVPTPAPNKQPTPIPGQNPNPNLNPTAVPSLVPKACYYKGMMYAQGQQWQDGCTYSCVCDNANTGKYTCTDRCPRFPSLPISCRLVYNPLDPCCKKATCVPSAPNPGQPGVPGSGTTLVPGLIPSGGTTGAPGLNPTKQPLIPNLDVCVYNGIAFHQGQSWNDGCSKTCRCDDASTGKVNCDERCPTFNNLKAGCSLVTDPSDTCCQIPQCINPNTTNPNQIVIGIPGTITNGGFGPVGNPGSPFTGGRSGCVYKGSYYTQGQSWKDGCKYDCVCVDGNAGQYRCTEKCARYAQIPSYCTMIQDPSKPCCQKPYCTPLVSPTLTPGQNPTLSPPIGPGGATPGTGPTAVPPTGTTLAPNPNTVSPLLPPQLQKVCKYGNQYYQQGQKWYDGCSKVCKCEDANAGFYRCQERCAQYNNLAAGCTLVPDPNDPGCCKAPNCFAVPSKPPQPGIYTPVPTQPGVISGFGRVPTPKPQPTPAPVPGHPTQVPPITPTPQPGCLYKGILHQPGEKWDDGCEYKCQCMDGDTGLYKCTKRCQTFPGVPNSKCVLVQDPKDQCCQVPYCDFLNPTPFPNGIPTPRPPLNPSSGPGATPSLGPGQSPTIGPNGPQAQPNPFLAPVLYPTPGPYLIPTPNGKIPGQIPQQQGFCEYKGVYYTQGQTWKDGCNLICRCEEPAKGYYQCTKRCHSYNNLPKTCQLKTDPSDSCCLVPDCNQYPTPAPHVTPPLGQTLPPTTPIPIVVPTPISGSFTGTGGKPGGFTGGGMNYCIYKAKIYNQGMTWDDGCNFKCECIDSSRGLYKCDDRCPRYYYLPPQCVYQKDPNDTCCMTAKCDLNLPTPKPQKPTPYPTVQPPDLNNFTPTLGPTVHWTGPTLKPTDSCLYTVNNNTYSKGQTWDDGCSYRCVCDDPSQNKYTCTERCQVYASLPSICSLIPDPNDKCCEVPSCKGFQPAVVFNGTGTPPPNALNILPIPVHTSFTGSSWGPGSSTYPVTGKRDVCIYKGRLYHQDDTWKDGCDYVCNCMDAERGLYKCVSTCPQYPQTLPRYCHKMSVPGQCCPSLTCDIPNYGSYTPSSGLAPTPAPTRIPGLSTTVKPTGLAPIIQIIPAGTYGNITGGIGNLPGGGYPIKPNEIGGVRDQCIYKNKVYNQGETWDDDCDFACKCVDGSTGYYECSPKCPSYNLPDGCYLMKSPGSCCETPQCMASWGGFINPVGHPESGFTVYGQYTGGFTGFRPGTNFTQYLPSFATTGRRDVCIYKGMIYQQGATWEDGCDYDCLCEDSSVGRYQCKPKCPSYTSLPNSCQLVGVPKQCCKQVMCTDPSKTTLAPTGSTLTPPLHPITPTPNPDPNCRDKIDNCQDYGHSACTGAYLPWAKRNCRGYCNIECYGIGQTTPKPVCKDLIDNCDAYGHDVCGGVYASWAHENCPVYCNQCPGATTTPMTTTTAKPCVDAVPNCADFGDADSICKDPNYLTWVQANCAKYCNFCPGAGGGTVIPVTGNAGWLLLMKGVAGVPGDLYQLWSGTGTKNPNVTAASYLTSEFQGHYKPDLSNHWNTICIDKVKVSIYNKGIEKAYIVFNATGADKMSWFTPDRIIDSTWSDIKTATSQYFQMRDDPNFARQFFAGGIINGCQSSGWMMVSTSVSQCPFEAGSKPAFYYAPGQTQAKFGFVQPGSGDVFAIQGHSKCPPANAHTQIIGGSQGCVYKGHVYKQGETWNDACSYKCSCVDAYSGKYRCDDMCPTYVGLPPSLKLQKVPGQCCPKVVLSITAVTHTVTNSISFCFYKGDTYGQGDTWDDGCLYKCECLDATRGYYKCKDKCPTWNIPLQYCHFRDPKPGLCCKVPVCPDWITIQGLDNFVEE